MDAGSSLTRDFQPLFLCGAAPRTFEAYEGTISRWELHTANPVLPAIDNRAMAGFKAALASAPDITSGATVNKHLRHIRRLLLAAGPRCGAGTQGLRRAIKVRPRMGQPGPRRIGCQGRLFIAR